MRSEELWYRLRRCIFIKHNAARHFQPHRTEHYLSQLQLLPHEAIESLI